MDGLIKMGEIKDYPSFLAGLIIVLAVVLTAMLAPLISPYDPIEQNMPHALQPPSAYHLLGTDPYGRDVLSRIIWGARVSLYVGLLSATIAMIVGVPFGALAGQLGGIADALLSRVIDIMLSFPGIILAIVVMSILGQSVDNTVLAISLAMIPRFARLARGEALQLSVQEYVQAAKASGAGNLDILVHHILPNILSPILVQYSLSIGSAIMIEAGLSFIGLGVQPPTPSWGEMLSLGRQYLYTAPWLSLFPGLAIMLTVLAFNLLGDGLRDMLDPRLKRV